MWNSRRRFSIRNIAFAFQFIDQVCLLKARKFSFRQKMSAGEYCLVPFTTGAWSHLENFDESPQTKKKLFYLNGKAEVVLTDIYTYVEQDNPENKTSVHI